MSRALFSALDFVTMDRPGVIAWSALPNFTSILPLTILPFADSELLNLAHYAPIGIHIPDRPGAQPLVCLLLHPDMAKPSPFDAQGKWLPPYTPIALRALPFTPGEKGECLFSPALAIAGGRPTWRAQSAPDTPTSEFKQVLELLRRLSQGARRLSDAGRMLILADVMVSLEPLPGFPDDRFFVASKERLATMDPARAAGLTAMGMLPMELAAACLFSSRYLTRKVAQDDRTYASAGMLKSFATQHRPDPVLPDALGQVFELDTSGLFSLDDLVRTDDPTQ
jgi:hypothetical protein